MAAIELTIPTGRREGQVFVPSSKSMAHRYLIAAALGSEPVTLICRGISRDIESTINCLKAMGADIRTEDDHIRVIPIKKQDRRERKLLCGESGSTLRLLLPVAGALGISGVFEMEGRLPERPMKEYEEELIRHGMDIRRQGNRLYFSGQLSSGIYSLPGNISSQYFSGLLFALPLLEGNSELRIEGSLESSDYVQLTESVLRESGITLKELSRGYSINGRQSFHMPAETVVEGDYSSAAFFLCIGAVSGTCMTACNLQKDSLQGDKRIVEMLARFGAGTEVLGDRVILKGGPLKSLDIDASMIPDLIPVLSIVAAVSQGQTRIFHAERLRMKESDRIHSTVQMLQSLGADVKEEEDGMVIQGKPCLSGGTVDSCNDHRIAMSAAVAACVCRKEVRILGAECVQKSYPAFWEDYASLKITDHNEEGDQA